MNWFLPLVLLIGCALCLARPRAGVVSIFGFAILVSNARQYEFFSQSRLAETLAVIPLSGLWVVDSLGVRILVMALLCGALLECVRKKRRIQVPWVFSHLAVMLTLGLASALINRRNLHLATSAMYFMVMSLMFLGATSNIAMDARAVRRLLNGLFGFVCVNAVAQIYQFVFTAKGNVDLTPGLLMSTTPTSTLAIAVLIPVLAKLVSTRGLIKGVLCLGVAVAQLVSSYLKGLLGLGVVVLLGIWRLVRRGGRRHRRAVILGVLLLVAAASLFRTFVLDAGELELSTEIVVQSGIVRVWSEFFASRPGVIRILIGYGPGSYGSVNTFGQEGQLTGDLGTLVTIGPAARDVFQLALTSLGNILWENGAVVVALFTWLHYRAYRSSALVAREGASVELRTLALGLMGGIVFIVLLYMTAFAETVEQPFLWAPAFIAFGCVEAEATRIRRSRIPRASLAVGG